MGTAVRPRSPRSPRFLVLSAILAILAGLPTSADARPQELPQDSAASAASETGPVSRRVTLEEALAEARDRNAYLRIAEARDRMARAGARAATAPLLPRLDLESGYLRTVDPVGAFGVKLRQGRFAATDLALDALNDPAAVTDWSSTASLSWGIVSPGAWADRAAAEHGARASGWATRRAREATDFRTRALYYEAVRTQARVDAARAAEEAAVATRDRFRRRMEEGLLTRADALQAEAELASARAALIEAERRRDAARTALGVHLAWGPDSLPVPADSLTDPGPPPAAPPPPASRSDLRARREGVRMESARRASARAAYLPRVEGFGAYSLHDADSPLGTDGTDWTVGIGVRWNLFSGFGRAARVQQASAALDSAQLAYDQARREATAEWEDARRAVRSARQAVDATSAARSAAEEGRDLMRRRFEEGLATASDLLQAEARAAGMRSRSVDALAAYRVALARLRFASATPEMEGMSP